MTSGLTTITLHCNYLGLCRSYTVAQQYDTSLREWMSVKNMIRRSGGKQCKVQKRVMINIHVKYGLQLVITQTSR